MPAAGRVESDSGKFGTPPQGLAAAAVCIVLLSATACRSSGDDDDAEPPPATTTTTGPSGTVGNPDGKYLAGASRDRTIRIWQIVPGPNQFEVVKLWYDKPAGQFLSVRWSADGKRIVTGDRSGRVAEWGFDPATDLWGQAQVDEYAKVAWAGQGTYFNKNAAKLTGKLLWSEGLHKQVWNARYSPDGLRVAAVGTDGTLTAYEAKTGRVLYRVHAPKNTALHALDWSPDGLLLAVGGGDKNVYVHNATNGTLYDTLVGHKTLVSAVSWSPNGRTLATAAGGQRVSEALNTVREGPDDAIHLWNRR